MKLEVGTHRVVCVMLVLGLWACGGGGSDDVAAPDLDTGADEVATSCQIDDDCAAETGGNSCLRATCDQAEGLCFTSADPAAEGVACDDGDACTDGDACHAGVCQGDAKACDDGNACTADTCDTGSGQCTFDQLPNGTACDDSNTCTSGDKCEAGTCNAGSNTCACQVDADCDQWDDANLCNGTLRCDPDHTCTVDPATVVTCDTTADTDCLKATCAPETGACASVPVNEGAACQPADPCLEAGACAQGACQGGTPRTCADDDDCTVDACEAGTGACSHTPAEVGDPCDDGASCTHDEACDAAGDCVPATVDTCDDGNPCTDDACDTLLGGCVHGTTLPGTPCDDGNACTTGDACNALHTCVSAGQVVCNDDNPCTANACDPATGECSFPTHEAGLPCDDGDLCTLDDACDDQGNCLAGTHNDCDDSNVCTSDQCDSSTGSCVFTPLEPGAPCSDFDACTTGDACNDDGACVTTGVVACDDDQACTVDACDPADGTCSNVPVEVGTPCTDGDACTTADACTVTGTCEPSGAVDCDDDEECTVDSCNTATGECLNDPVDDGTSCDDGDGCTLNDSCQAGACQVSTQKSCDDGQSCTTDSCRPSDGQCLHDGAPHENEPCTHADTCLLETRCQAGACGGGVPVNDCCHEDADCVTGEACQSATCVNETCVYEAEVCAGESAGCTMKLCREGLPCGAAAVSLAGRVVVYERFLAADVGTVKLRTDPVGAFTVSDLGVSLAGATAANLYLKPLRLPRGTTTLRFRATAPSLPADASALRLVDLGDGLEVQGRVVDLEPQGEFEVLYDVSRPVDRSASFRLLVQDPTWALQSVQAVHHGAEGCPNLVGPEAVEWLDLSGTALMVTSCANDAGAKLVVWTETATNTRLGWRLWNGQWWSEEHTAGGEFELSPEFSVACVSTSAGWLITYGKATDSGFATSRLVRIGATGTATAIDNISRETGDHVETPAMATLPNGDVVVAFTSDVVDGDGLGIALARFAPDGAAIGTTNIQVNEITNGTQRRPTIAVGATRVFVAWESKLGANKTQLAFRLFDHNLAPVLPEASFAVSADVEYLRPSAAPIAAEQGIFLVAYEAVGKVGDAGSGVYRSLFGLDGAETVNEQVLASSKANDQKLPVAFAVPGGVLVQWQSDHVSKNTFDLVVARIDAVGLQGNGRVAFDVEALGKALPAAPGAVDHVFVKDGNVGLGRLGLACDEGLFECDVPETGVCVDGDLYLPLVDGCLGLACSGVCP